MSLNVYSAFATDNNEGGCFIIVAHDQEEAERLVRYPEEFYKDWQDNWNKYRNLGFINITECTIVKLEPDLQTTETVPSIICGDVFIE